MCLADNRDVRRVIKESVPGKQVTIAHVTISSVPEVYECPGTNVLGAIDILALSPFETATIVTDIAAKASNVQIGFLDRFIGSMVVTGDVESVDMAPRAVDSTLSGLLGLNVAGITRA